jgi:hypothetical protein
VRVTRDKLSPWLFYPAAILWGAFIISALMLMWLIGVPIEVNDHGEMKRYRWFWKLKPKYKVTK